MEDALKETKTYLICYAGFEDGGDYPDEYPDAYEKFEGTQEELNAYLLSEETRYQLSDSHTKGDERWLRGVYSGEPAEFEDPLDNALVEVEAAIKRREEHQRRAAEIEKQREEATARRTYEALRQRFEGNK
jgi:hypothetical protein